MAGNSQNCENLASALTNAISRAISSTLQGIENNHTSQQQGQSNTQQSNDRPQPQLQGRLPTRQISPTAVLGEHSRQTSSGNTFHFPSVVGGMGRGKRKRSAVCQAKPAKIYTKDIVCILPSSVQCEIPIPRGAKRAQLAELGLTGKISINAGWKVYDVLKEVSSVFASAFNLEENEILLFDYLSIMPGTKKLKTPKVSLSFCWNAPEVLSICSQGSLYILAKKNPFSNEMEQNNENNDENFDTNEELSETACNSYSVTSLENCDLSPSTSSSNNVSTLSTESTPYRSYLGWLEDIDQIEVSDDEVEELRVQSAIQNSLASQATEASNACDDTDSVTLAYVIGEHIKTEMLGKSHDVEVSKNLINVRRKHVFTDGIKKIGRSSFQASLPLSVKFADELGSSEGAVDLGGPTREFLRLAIQDMFLSNAFAGPASRKMLVLNQEAKRGNLYFLCGKLLAISLCNGGSVGRCLAPCMYQYLVYGESNCKPSIDDVHDCTIKNTLLQISGCNDNSSFVEVNRRENVINCFSQAGYYGLPKFENKQRLLDELCRFYVVDKACSALAQFKEGLSTLNVLPLMKQHPNLFEDVFCHEAERLTAVVIDGLFKVVYAEEGTRQREQEELIVMYWRDYLQDRQVPEDSGSSGAIKLKDILIFATCASEVPPLGFQPSPTIQFWNDVRPRSNTCGNVLFLPLHKMNSEVSYEAFKSFMDDAIINSPTFGAP